VGTADVKDLVVALPDTRDIAGRVTVSGGGHMPQRLEISIGTGSTTPIAIAPDGTFQLTAVDRQSIRIDAASIPGYSIASLNYGNLDVMLNPMRFSATDNAELQVHLRTTSSPVSVNGRIIGITSALSRSAVWLSHASGVFRTLETSVAADGSFSFNNVVPGNYSVQLVAPGIRTAAVPVVITGTNVPGIRIEAPKEVRGRVVIDGSSPIPRFSIPLIAARSETLVTIDPQTDGTFTVFMPAGEHRAGAPLGLPSGYAIQALSYGSVDLLRDPLKVSSDDSPELIIRLKG
jgi:hypothetical protein